MPPPLHISPTPTPRSKAVETRTGDWHQLWLGELGAVKAAFEGAKGALPPGGPPLPPHAGRVVLIRGLLAHVERTAGHLASMGAAVPAVPKAAESAAAYDALHSGLGQYANALNMQVRRLDWRSLCVQGQLRQ